jgi:hypothetical protein
MSRLNSLLICFVGITNISGRRRLRWALLLFVLVVRPAAAGDVELTRIRQTIHVDPVGDARIKLEITMPAGLYTQIKAATPNVAAMMRRLGWGQGWELIEDATGRFDDLQSSLVFEMVERGMARSEGRDGWTIPTAAGADLEMIAQHENFATLTGTANTELGLTTQVVQCVLPAGCANVRLLTNPDRVAYTLSATPTTGDRVDAEFELFARPQLLSCLAKCYANPQFNLLWAARSVFHNTGELPITDYRVRHRIIGYSEWSAWKRSKRVLPGQTVIEPFFPLLDLEKLAGLNSAVTTAVEVEYEYRTPGGETVRETDQRQLRLLARNQVVFSSLTPEEQVGWFDQFNYGPMLMASFVTGNDPVIQQVAGVISGRLGGVNASGTDEEAFRFLQDLFNFLSESGISYQTPPGGTFQGQFGQHIKHGRDVLRNRAGTCVDLAILYGSICQAVGLEPVMVLIPGHCFPAVKMPQGGYYVVEATCIGRSSFEEAAAVGAKEWNEFQQSGVGYLVDVQSLHDLGVDTLDLPHVASDFLTTLGYNVTVTAARTERVVATAPAQQPATQEVAEEKCYAAIRIVNSLDSPINYSIKVGDGEWVDGTVEAGGVALHGGEITREQAENLPTIHLRYDYDLSDEVQMWEYELQWSVHTQLDEETVPTINGYRFGVDGNGWLELYHMQDAN